jgi:hypothetical protein
VEALELLPGVGGPVDADVEAVRLRDRVRELERLLEMVERVDEDDRHLRRDAGEHVQVDHARGAEGRRDHEAVASHRLDGPLDDARRVGLVEIEVVVRRQLVFQPFSEGDQDVSAVVGSNRRQQKKRPGLPGPLGIFSALTRRQPLGWTLLSPVVGLQQQQQQQEAFGSMRAGSVFNSRVRLRVGCDSLGTGLKASFARWVCQRSSLAGGRFVARWLYGGTLRILREAGISSR